MHRVSAPPKHACRSEWLPVTSARGFPALPANPHRGQADGSLPNDEACEVQRDQLRFVQGDLQLGSKAVILPPAFLGKSAVVLPEKCHLPTLVSQP